MSSSAKPPVTRIGKYQILTHVATGGMGTVYKARDAETDRVVALKVLEPELATNPILVERFHREAKHAGKLSHRNIVEFFESGQADGIHYLAMEFIPGVDLSEYIRRRSRIEPEEARRILIQACKALAHAFEQGIIHRDIKPSNFLLANEGGRCRVKLTDLGLSRMESDEEYRVTRAGTTVGTVDYMAPEQARDASLADVRSDIYSLGCTLYHMLAGRPPFADGGIGERIYKHIAADVPDVRQFNPDVPAGLWAVIRRMLAKHPDDRFQTPDELLEALRSAADDAPAPAPAADSLDLEAPPSSPLIPARPSPPSQPVSSGRRTKRKTTAPELTAVPPDAADGLGVTADQKQAASGQFTHASEVLRAGGGDPAYARGLLVSAVRLDPTNLVYRKMLREVGRDQAKAAGWFTGLLTLPARGRFRKARRAGEHRKALELGEDLLLRLPNDVATVVEMSDSAEELGLNGLAVWLLEDARQQVGKNLGLLRALAGLYERLKMFNQAIEVWEKVKALDPSDFNVGTKIKDLAASETIARSRRG